VVALGAVALGVAAQHAYSVLTAPPVFQVPVIPT
jgi:hypothetical protein